MSCSSSVRQQDSGTRRSSTPSKRAWEPMEGEDIELRNIRSSQGDLNKNIKGSRPLSKSENNGRKTVASTDSGVSSEVRLRSVELGVEETSPKFNGHKEQKESTTNGVPDVTLKNGQNSLILEEKAKDPELALKVGHSCGTGCCSRAWNLLTRVFKSKRFESDKLESLYQRYIFRLNQKFASCLIVLLLILSLVLVLFQFLLEKHKPETKNIEGILLVVFAVIYIGLLLIVNRSGSSQAQLKWISYALLFISFGIVLVVVLCPTPRPDPNTEDDRSYSSPSDGVWITIFFIYMTYTMLPVRMRIAVLGGCLLPTIHLISSAAVNADHDHLWRLVSNLLLF